MPDPTPAPAPSIWRPALTAFAKYVVPALLAAAATWFGLPPQVVERVKEIPVPIGGDGGKTVDFGWHPPSPDEIAAALDPNQTDQFADTAAGRAVLGDEDVFLWRAFTAIGVKVLPWVNQKDVGCCVGCGYKHSADTLLAVQCSRDPLGSDWKPISVEAIYAGSRNEVGGGRISGDGSVGQWAADWIGRVGGAAPAEKYATVDLTEFSPARARSMGRAGQKLPADVLDAAKKHPAKGTALVRTFDDVAKAIRQGYPVAVCSNVGFAGMARDADGFIRPSGSWAHCMCFIGVRGGGRPGVYCLNSWGPDAHTGPTWPADAPTNGFWIDAAVVTRMVQQADSYALADMTGFPARRLPDWFIAAPRPEPFTFTAPARHPLGLRNRLAATRVMPHQRPEPASVGW